MLLQRAGVEVKDKELLGGLSMTSGENALTAADLSDMVKALKLNIHLEVGFLPLDAIPQLASREPFLILMTSRSIGGSDAFDHFILIEGRASGSFVIADPILPNRTRLKDETFHSDAHGKMIDGRAYAMVLKLTKQGSKVSRLLPSDIEDNYLRDWEQAYRLPRMLPPGKWVLSASQIRQNDNVSDVIEGVKIKSTTDVSVISVSRGVGKRSQVNLNLALISGTGDFRLPGEAFSFDRRGTVHGEMRFEQIPDISLHHSFEFSTSAALEWENGAIPSAVSANAALEWAGGPLAVGLAANARFDGRFVAIATPSISYRIPTRSGFSIEAAITSPYRIGDSRPNVDLQIAVSRHLGIDFQVSAFFNQSILLNRGAQYNQLGITLTYGVPRRFRRAKIAPDSAQRFQNTSD